jgi:hypothetical protein
MSFGPGVKAAQAPAAAAAAAAKQETPTAPQQPGTSVSDAELARTFKRPGEMPAWQPSQLRIYGEAGAPAESGRPAEAAAAQPGSKGAKAGAPGSSGKAGKRPHGGAQAGPPSGGKGSEPAANAFAPLRAPKRKKE